MPKSISHMKDYKGKDWRSWLLFASLPAVEKYLQHWMLLVMSAFILLKETVTEAELVRADTFLNLFVRDAQDLYGSHIMVSNLHGLLHLVLCARRWGNAYGYSTLTFEGNNGMLVRLLHGTRRIGDELINTLKIIFAYQTLKRRCNMVKDARLKIPRWSLLGTRKIVNCSAQEMSVLRSQGDVNSFLFYERAEHGRTVYTSLVYKRENETNNNTVCYLKDNRNRYRVIRFFFKTIDGKMFALLNRFVVRDKFFKHLETNYTVTHIIPISEGDVLDAVEVSAITEKLRRIHDYVCVPPNKVVPKKRFTYKSVNV